MEQRVAEALAERKVLADIVESTDALVQVIDLNFRIMAINRATADELQRVYGFRPKVGDNLLEMLKEHPDHQAHVQKYWRRALAGEQFTAIDKFSGPELNRIVGHVFTTDGASMGFAVPLMTVNQHLLLGSAAGNGRPSG